MNYAPLTKRHEEIAKAIVNAAYAVHKELGPGLLESVYEPCFCHELSKQEWRFQRQVIVPIVYDGITFDEGFRLDVVVEDLVICELKVVDRILSVHEAQLLSYMKLTDKRLGFLINFNVPLIKHGIKRFIR
ncbi:MAG: GxxExxY protein [Anaerolineales bacterium]|nr:GxxExxY protein [Anaerolineales bacterium]